MSETLNHDYTFKKGDNLDAIAKKFGVKDGGAIWKLPENKAIASKRGKPEQLEAGDKLTIPPGEKQLKDMRAATEKGLKAVESQIADVKKSIAHLDHLIADSNAQIAEIIKEAANSRDKIKSAGSAADAAAILINVGRALGSLAGKGLQGARISVKELGKAAADMKEAQLGAEILSEGKAILGDRAIMVLSKLMQLCQDSTNTAMQVVGSVGDSWDKMTSPSFWANTAVQLMNGKTWSEAVSTDIISELAEQLRQARQQTLELVTHMQKQKAELAARLAALETSHKDIEAKARALH